MSQDHVIDRLFATIVERKNADPQTSYTATLLHQGVERCAKKFGEDSVEVVLSAASGNSQAVIAESGDVLYHLLVLWAACGVKPGEVYAALAAREGRSGLDEKASRKKKLI